jgi:hypothetical protein
MDLDIGFVYGIGCSWKNKSYVGIKNPLIFKLINAWGEDNVHKRAMEWNDVKQWVWMA